MTTTTTTDTKIIGIIMLIFTIYVYIEFSLLAEYTIGVMVCYGEFFLNNSKFVLWLNINCATTLEPQVFI